MTSTLNEGAGTLSFGPFSLDLSNARLTRGRRPVALTPKALALLHYLASRPGRLVTKEELLGALWVDVVVCDASIKVCVREIRKALGDSATEPAYIQTVHRRGYRFIATVTDAVASDASDIASAVAQLGEHGVPLRALPAREAFAGQLPSGLHLPAANVGLLRAAFDAAAASGRRQYVVLSMNAEGTQIIFF